VCGTLDLSDVAHGRQLRSVEGVTANVQPKKWSLAGVCCGGVYLVLFEVPVYL
jgi:hypothetical protein